MFCMGTPRAGWGNYILILFRFSFSSSLILVDGSIRGWLFLVAGLCVVYCITAISVLLVLEGLRGVWRGWRGIELTYALFLREPMYSVLGLRVYSVVRRSGTWYL